MHPIRRAQHISPPRAALCGDAGFTLMEIALSILVISIGLMAVFALFPAGMSANKHAVDDTYAAMFAEEVFHGARGQAAMNWGNIENMQIPPRSSDMWADLAQQVVIANEADFRTIEYNPADVEDLTDYAVRYRFTVESINDNRAYALLEVLAGAFGPTDDPILFYTEFFNSSPAP